MRGAASEIAQSAEAKRALFRARAALKALAKAASAAGALVRAAWRTSGSHARAFGSSREARALRARARRAARTAAATARAAGVRAGRGGAQAWNRAVSSGGRLRAAAKRKLARA
jgi:hypothetical protein